MYTILIRLPPETSEDAAPSIKMITEDVPLSELNIVPMPVPMAGGLAGASGVRASDRDSYYSAVRRPSHMPDIRMPLNAKAVPKQLGASGATSG